MHKSQEYLEQGKTVENTKIINFEEGTKDLQLEYYIKLLYKIV